MATENYKSVKDFIVKVDAEDLGGNLIAEASRLTDEQRDELIHRKPADGTGFSDTHHAPASRYRRSAGGRFAYQGCV